jgi:formylglycine-generating enzyme
MPRLCSILLLSLLVASSASAVTMAWTPIGNPGQGGVASAYSIGTYEVTNAQYAEFLNAKATSSDPFGLYNSNMADPAPSAGGLDANGFGGIARTGAPGAYAYTAIAGRENLPVNYVSFYDAMRFANWMNNGQGAGNTEAGAYTLLGGTPEPSNGRSVIRNDDASIALTNDAEWYKAAFYDPRTNYYWEYQTGSNYFPSCTYPGSSTPNTANCAFSLDFTDETPGGSYINSASPYGTFDQAGNVWEWSEAIRTARICASGDTTCDPRGRGNWGGSFEDFGYWLNTETFVNPNYEFSNIGFRLVAVPEPGTGLLVIAGLFILAGWRRARD